MSNASLPLEMIKSANLMEQLMSYLGTEEGKRMLTGAGIGGGLGALTGGMTGGWRGGLVGLLTGGALGGAAGHNWDRLMGGSRPQPAVMPALKTRKTLQGEAQHLRQNELNNATFEQLKGMGRPRSLGGDDVAKIMFPGYPNLLRQRNLTSRPASPLRPADWRVGDRNANMPAGTMQADLRTMWGN